MKTTKLRSVAVVGVLWLTMGAGCSKDPPLPNCKNGSCCWDGYENKYITRLSASPAYFGGSTFNFREPFRVVDGTPLVSAAVCKVQFEMISKMNLKNNVTIDPNTNKVRLVDSTRRYPYLVWGIIYELPIYPFSGPAIHSVRVEKIEEAP